MKAVKIALTLTNLPVTFLTIYFFAVNSTVNILLFNDLMITSFNIQEGCHAKNKLNLKTNFGSVIPYLDHALFSPQISYADAPKDVKIEYDSGAQTLTVTITHKSAFPGFHHIKNVDVKRMRFPSVKTPTHRNPKRCRSATFTKWLPLRAISWKQP